MKASTAIKSKNDPHKPFKPRQEKPSEAPKKFSGTKLQFLNIDETFDGPLIVTFTGTVGGISKTTTTLNYGAFLAKSAELSGSPMRVLVFDGDVENGNLSLRIGGQIKPNMLDMLIHMNKHGKIEEYEEMQQFVFSHPRIKNLDILPSPESVDIIDQLEDDDLNDTVVTLARFYDVIVIDTGTQITERTNQAWLAFSNQVYLMVEPDIAGMQSALTYSNRLRKLGIVVPDRFRLIITKSDIKAEINPQEAVKRIFDWIPDHKIFSIKDYQQDMLAISNIGDFLVLESPDYAEEILNIARRSLEDYTSKS